MDAILTRDGGIVPEPLLGLLEAAELVHSIMSSASVDSDFYGY